MSFRAIAERAGCSHTKLYSYFDSKADLTDALRLRSYEMLSEELSATRDRHDDPVGVLGALLETYVRFGLDRPQLYGLLYSGAGELGEGESPLLEAKVEALSVARDALAAAVECGAISIDVDPLTAAHVFWSGAHGLVHLALGGFLVVERSLDDLLPALVRVLMDGISSTPATVDQGER